MAYFVIIRGPLAVGKTAVAKALAESVNGVYISVDEVLREYNLDKVDPKQECIPAENFLKGDDIILPYAREVLEEGRVVVFDGCFYHKEQIEHLIANLPYEHHVFTLKASVETCIERDQGRERVYGEDAAWAVHGLVSKFDYGTVIDTDDQKLEETLREVISYL